MDASVEEPVRGDLRQKLSGWRRGGRTPRRGTLMAAALLLSGGLSDAAADPGGLRPSIGLSAGPEYFSWRELDGAGNTWLHETGPRFSVSASADDLNLRRSGPVYQVFGRAYVGYVGYSGMTQPTPPLFQSIHAESHTRYLGGVVEATGGYRFWNPFNSVAVAVDVVGGLGLDQWHRVIGNTTAPTGTQPAQSVLITGAVEDYRIPYLKTGLGLFHAGNGWMQYLQGGVKLPFATHEEARLFGVTVAPGSAVSFYVKWQLARLNANGDRSYFMSLFYDGFRFSPSPAVNGVYQPESHEDVVGLQLGYYFNPAF